MATTWKHTPAMNHTTTTSSQPILALLQEQDETLQVHALQWIHQHVDRFWAEIASSLATIELFVESKTFPQRQLAASVASRVFYHLEELDDSLRYALGAGPFFDVGESSEYVYTLLSRALDRYTESREETLEGIVGMMFTKCLEDGELQQAVGIALETRRLDKLNQVCELSSEPLVLLKYCLELSQTVVQDASFRQELLRQLVSLFTSQTDNDWYSLAQCFHHLEDAEALAHLLDRLINENCTAIAMQIAFDLASNENQPFLLRVSNALENTNNKLSEILSGTTHSRINLQILHSASHTDPLLLKHLKEQLDSRNSTTHSAALLAHALMNAGTTRDQFIRDNMEWLGRASNWHKFSATASFGVVHRGHFEKALVLMGPYLVQEDGTRPSPYLEGGALYGLGLIHANRGGDQVEYLANALQNSENNEIVQHGACLGIGLNALCTASDQTYSLLKDILYQDNADSGLSAGLAMGMVLVGSASLEQTEDMLNYARETSHERIVRGLGLGLALTALGTEQHADALVDDLLSDKDPILRYSGCFTLALAYVASENNSALRRLLHVAVSDVSDDVRRAAVISIGFVLAGNPDKVPRVVRLLAESYNPHVRYGAALALGIACAGHTPSEETLGLLNTLCNDRVDFCRQGALLAKAMVLMQSSPDPTEFRAELLTIISGKMSDTMTKVGAVLALGILEAGGRNVGLSLLSPSGQLRIGAVVGMFCFVQYWYWYPLMHCISLSFRVTALLGVNETLGMPSDFVAVCSARPSRFAYPAPLKIEEKQVAKQVYNAELSISAKAKNRAAQRLASDGSNDAAAVAEEEQVKEKEKEPQQPKAKAEPESFEIPNGSRITLMQQGLVHIPSGQRYTPVLGSGSRHLGGIMVLKDSTPHIAPQLIVPEQFKTLGVGEEEEPSPPEPFHFTR